MVSLQHITKLDWCICMLLVLYYLWLLLTLPHQMGRMMMNLRGIIFDDPEHTVHLQTLQFAAGPGSEDEDLG
jgi:hypothetical protein